jgi:hypothetical protein
VVFVVGTVLLSVLVVALTGGSFARLGRIELRAVWLLLLGLFGQIALELVDWPEARLDDVAFALLLATYALILGFCALNRKQSGMVVVMVGVSLNVLVIALNQGMPVKDGEVERDDRTVREPITRTAKQRPLEDDDRLTFLADVLTVPGLPNQQFSIGDVVIGIGVADVCFEASRRPRRRGIATDEVSERA